MDPYTPAFVGFLAGAAATLCPAAWLAWRTLDANDAALAALQASHREELRRAWLGACAACSWSEDSSL